jgi:hypothetical protein
VLLPFDEMDAVSCASPSAAVAVGLLGRIVEERMLL